jgi:hypothetical protein
MGGIGDSSCFAARWSIKGGGTARIGDKASLAPARGPAHPLSVTGTMSPLQPAPIRGEVGSLQLKTGGGRRPFGDTATFAPARGRNGAPAPPLSAPFSFSPARRVSWAGAASASVTRLLSPPPAAGAVRRPALRSIGRAHPASVSRFSSPRPVRCAAAVLLSVALEPSPRQSKKVKQAFRLSVTTRRSPASPVPHPPQVT